MKVIEQKIRSLYHSTVFLWLVSVFFHIFSFFWVLPLPPFCLFFTSLKTSYPDPLTLDLGRHFELIFHSQNKSITWFLLRARVFSLAAAILECGKTLGTRLGNNNVPIESFLWSTYLTKGHPLTMEPEDSAHCPSCTWYEVGCLVEKRKHFP